MRAVEGLDVCPKKRLPRVVAVEGSQNSALEPREHELVAGEAIELALLTARRNLLLIGIHHRRDDFGVGGKCCGSENAHKNHRLYGGLTVVRAEQERTRWYPAHTILPLVVNQDLHACVVEVEGAPDK